jgi:hypothetical protein
MFTIRDMYEEEYFTSEKKYMFFYYSCLLSRWEKEGGRNKRLNFQSFVQFYIDNG